MEQWPHIVNKLESMRVLGSGIAHDLNNPLNTIINCAEFLRLELESQDPDLAKYAESLMEEGRKATTRVRDFFNYLRAEEEEPEMIMVEDIVRGVERMTSAFMRHHSIEYSVNVENDVLPVECRESQIRHVLLNLILNAQQAVERRFGEGAGQKQVALNALGTRQDNADFVCFAVVDNGEGMDEEKRSRILKAEADENAPSGPTAGLGLSVAKDIVRNHGGALDVESVPNSGTTVRVFLPAA